ncbi:hydrolase [Streptacidiphilus sp. EB129]|uniref:hydrolase n=1 Tax=Streptacidiphilus sp. EB129 TaxID=3156262 RepID=UPI0035182C80
MPSEPSPDELSPPCGPALLLSGPRLADGRTVDVRISGGRIEAVGAAGRLSAPERLDLTGYLLLPAPVEAHAHLDEAFTATPRQPGRAPGAGADAVGQGALEDEPLGEQLQRRITEAALSGLGYGAVVQRTQVRIGGRAGLAGVTAALQAGRALHGLMELQVVVLPGRLTGRPGAAGLDLLREAVAMGAHAVGGFPDGDPDPEGHLRTVIAVAEKGGIPLDLHLDVGEPDRLARLTTALAPLGRPVSLGPCPALGRLAPRAVRACAEELAKAGVAVVALPQSSRCVGLDGAPGDGLPCAVGNGTVGNGTVGPYTAADAAGPAGGRALPVGLLSAAGVLVAAGSGALRDTANPVGRVDPLEAAFLLAASGELDEHAAYGTVSGVARTVLGLPPVLIAPGFPADLLAVRGDSLRGVLSGGHSRVVFYGGRVVSRTSAVREFAETTAAAVPRQGRCP